MAVDGVALKAAIDAWTIADGSADKAAAFLVADGIRSLEKALSGFFHLCNGVTLLALGLALATGRGFPRWLGWVGAAAGTAFLVEGVVVAQTGFSHQAANIALVPTVLLPVFLIGVAVAMWRTTPISQEGELVQGTLAR
jgi:branched-subunit amino acid transport protein